MLNNSLFKSFLAVHRVLDCTKHADFLAPLAFRVFLFFPFWMAGTQKLGNIEDTAAWFEYSLELPLPVLMAWLAGLTETAGAACLLAGFAVRYITVPLMVTMLFAIFAVHWDNGWAAIASSSDPDIAERLDRARSILKEHGNYDWLTGKGSIVILQNGIEFGVTYFVLCLSLFFTGAGKYVSIDYWLKSLVDKCTKKKGDASSLGVN